jgi:hypothetical protein
VVSSQIRSKGAIHVCGIAVSNIQCFKLNKYLHGSPYL